LVPFTVHYQLLRGFYAFEDTRTPVTINVWIAGSNIALAFGANAVLPDRWVSVALAASYSLSYLVGVGISALAPLCLAMASWQAAGGKVGLGWGIAFHVVNDIGFANVFPVGLALYRNAPENSTDRDFGRPGRSISVDVGHGLTLSQAARTTVFWYLVALTFLVNAVNTALLLD
ncbi:MAG: lipid II flippase MurJ, partial [Thermoplasmatota archaeon]